MYWLVPRPQLLVHGWGHDVGWMQAEPPRNQRMSVIASEESSGLVTKVTSLRTDTTLDLSQKAEKVCLCLVRGLIKGLEAGRDGAFVAGGDRQLRERELPQPEILLWTTPKEPPRALQTSECNELLDPTRASCLILAQRQPGKFIYMAGVRVSYPSRR